MNSNNDCQFVKEILSDVKKFETSDITEAFSSEYFDQDDASGEINAVGAGIGGGFGNTAELKPMKFKEAMKTPDKEHWLEAVEEEHDKMVKLKV